jgi:uncharacterized protein (DUF885 family)
MLRRLLPLVALTACSTAPSPPLAATPAGAQKAQQPAPLRSIAPAPRPDAKEFDKARAEASAGVRDPKLKSLLERHWSWELREQPLWATQLGVHALDAMVPDASDKAHAARAAFRQKLLQEVNTLHLGFAGRNGVDEANGNWNARRTTSLLQAQLRAQIASEKCAFHLWTVSPRDNPLTEWNELHELHKVKSEKDARTLLARYFAIPASIDQVTSNLRLGLSRKLVANAESVGRVITMVERQLRQDNTAWPLAKPLHTAYPQLPEPFVQVFKKELKGYIPPIRKALEGYRDFLKNELLPQARDEENTGLGALSIGRSCYAARIEAFTTLGLKAETIHRIGLREIEKTDGEMLELGKKALKLDKLDRVLQRLRQDKSLYFATEKEIVAAAQKTLDEAKQIMPRFFGRLPKADCVMRRIPAYEAPYTTIAYFRPAHADGSKPGEYFINVYKPETRPRYEAVVLAIHEAVPGHHLQIAIAQELGALPAFRKHGGFTAFVEGWGLYTERLGLEMGLYKSDLDRIGMVSFDAWRAARLVVDTGIHAMGWSRKKAKDFMIKHTALSPDNIDNEVDRYINWPGQALGYKMGQLEFWKLRRSAEKELGANFDIKAFHDAALGGGALTLAELKSSIQAYVEKTKARTSTKAQ